MGCERIGNGAVLCKPAGDGGAVWWDAGGNALWIVDWGKLADWATVVVASIAVLAAWVASRRSYSLQAELNRLEQARETRSEAELARRIEAEARGAQADLVAAWLAFLPAEGPRARAAGIEYWNVVVNNDSALPVYDVTLSVVGPGQPDLERYSDFMAVLPPGESSKRLGTVDLLPMMAEGPDGTVDEFTETEEDLQVRVWFRDTAGRRWQRDVDGQLRALEIAGRAS